MWVAPRPEDRPFVPELYLYSPMGHTACTEPQCLYKGDLYLYLLWNLKVHYCFYNSTVVQ